MLLNIDPWALCWPMHLRDRDCWT